ncbi:hypothetical protein [Facklamia miroungae]|uniref:YolD-like protein n=1 Tax=Facklamia miroungae TaxID=120956 RepID=A0A1G7P3S8_9LACT|nr:hypothetical protein [Facklamia miroungae]NKZ28548.1 hypothetical protein [Facklamia miroungae]SDF80100.1 hypothetical protein SAMN05421791_10189 [Facklamia miroungae]
MSVDRSYLQSKAAREYQDRKMAKWMGFFLSEHTGSLKKDYNTGEAVYERQSPQEKMMLLSQAFTQKLEIRFTYIDSTKRTTFINGIIDVFDFDKVGVRVEGAYLFINMDDLIRIDYEE